MRIVSLIFLALALSAPVWAQESRAAIVGRVTDSTGAVIPGAAVTATNESTNVPVATKANEQGNYQILFLNPGRYKVSAAADGFKSFARGNIELRVSDRVSLDIALEVGDVKETVVVVAQTPLLESASANVGQVVDNRRVSELPLPHGNSRSLFLMLPGVNTGFADTLKYQDPSRPSTIALFSYNGSPFGSTEFTMDGVPNTQTANSSAGSSISNQPPSDAIQEIKMETAYDASVGHSSGAHINMVMKSGTNALHGTGYFFYRNPVLNANDFFSNRSGVARGEFDYKRLGGSVNGPVKIPRVYNGKDRTFFAYTYEYMDEKPIAFPIITTVPSMDARKGDFSSLLKLGSIYQIYDPATIAVAPNGRFSRQPLPGNVVPQSRINPVAGNLLKWWPQPNATGTPEGLNNLELLNLPVPNKFQNHIARVDHYVSNKQRIYGRFSRYFKREGKYYDNLGNDASGMYARIKPWNFVLDDIYTVSPNMVIDFRYGFQRFPMRTSQPSEGFDLASLGFSKTLIDALAFRPPAARTLPGVNISSIEQLVRPGLEVSGDNIHSWFVDVNRPAGNHGLKFGADIRAYLKNRYLPGEATPRFTFGAGWTNGPLDNSPTAPGGVGQAMAAFLLGRPTSATLDYNDSYAAKSTYYAAYIQDDWRVRPRLTITLGLRYEYEGPVTDRYNRSVRGFDATAELPITKQVEAAYAAKPVAELAASQFQVRGGVLFAGTNNQPRTLWTPERNNFAPRVGFSYNPVKNTVVRGGYGLFYVPTGIPGQVVPIQTGYSQSTPMISTLDSGLTFFADLTNPYPNGINTPRGNKDGLMTYVGRGISFFDTGRRAAYNQRWDLHVQQLLPGQFLLDIGYAGSRATRLLISRPLSGTPINYLSRLPYRDQPLIDRLSSAVPNPFYPLLPGTGLAGTNVSVGTLLCPYPQFGCSVTTTSNQGYSWYHSMQMRVERRFANGFTYLLGYTWSKLMEGTSFANALDAVPYRTISVNDRPHHMSMSGIYELPFGKGRKLLASVPQPMRLLVSGWQVGAIFQAWSGQPLGFGDVIFNGDIKSIPLPAAQRSMLRWFNIDAGFERTSAKQLSYHYRTAPFYYSGLRSDIMNTWDISLLKYTNLTERVTLQFRAEAFNAFNHPSFSAPNTTVTSSAFGQVTSTTNLPRIIQFGFKVVY